MFLAAVIDPAILGQAFFEEEAYAERLLNLLDAVEVNGLLLLDPHKKLRNKILELLDSGIPSRAGEHRVQELLTEWLKVLPKKQRGLYDLPVAICPSHLVHDHKNKDLLDVAVEVRKKCDADVIVSAETAKLKALGETEHHATVSEYGHCCHETARKKWARGLEPDDLTITTLTDMVARTTRHSREIRIFDKMIGKGDSLWKWRNGIQFILDIWRKAGVYKCNECTAHIVTCCDPNMSDQGCTEVQSKMKRELKQKLKFSGDVQIHLKILPIKRSERGKFHPRYLQAGSAVLRFDNGFDLFDPETGDLIKQDIRVVREVYRVLQEYFALEPFSPKGSGAKVEGHSPN